VKLAVQKIAAGQGDVISIAGVSLLADPGGSLFWPEHGLLAVADLHLEKGLKLRCPRHAAAAL
jgi:hypothetical protein